MKYKLTGYLLASCLLVTNIVKAQDISRYSSTTLEKIWSKVEANNTEVDINNKEIEIRLKNLKSAKAARLPDVDAIGEYARVSNMPLYDNGIFKTPTQIPVLHNYYKLGTGAYFNLYEGNKTSLEIAKSTVNVKISQIEKEMTVSDMKLASAAYYLDMLRASIFKGLLSQDIQSQKKQLEQITILHRNGVVLKSDVLRAELKLAKQTLALDQVINDFRIANQKLNTLMGIEDPEALNTIEPLDQDSIMVSTYDEYLDAALVNAYSKKISESKEQISELEFKSVQGDSAPKIGLFANYAYSYPQIFLYPYAGNLYGFGMAGVKISYSISSLYKNKDRKTAAKLEIDKSKLEILRKDEEIKDAVYQSFLRLREAQTRIKVAGVSLKQSLENQRINHNTYFNHLSLITDLLDADTQVLQSRFDLESSKIAAQFQYFQLLHTIGKL